MPHDAAGLRHRADRLVGLVARMTRDERAAVRVRDQHRLLRHLERVERRAVAAVRHVDRHADRVHPLDDRHAKVAEPFVAPLGRAVADEVAPVVRELRDALAEAVKRIDVVGPAEMFRVLNAEDDADLSRRLDAVEVGGAVDAQQILVAAGDERVPPAEELKALIVRIRPADADRRVKDVDARALELLEVGRGERLGRLRPSRLEREVQREDAEHVDDERPLHQARSCARSNRHSIERTAESGRD